MYNLKISSLKKSLKIGGKGNAGLLTFIGVGAVAAAGAWFLFKDKIGNSLGSMPNEQKAYYSAQGVYPPNVLNPLLDPGNAYSHPLMYQAGRRSFHDYTRNENGLPTPYVEVNFPLDMLNKKARLANTIDKGVYVPTITGPLYGPRGPIGG